MKFSVVLFLFLYLTIVLHISVTDASKEFDTQYLDFEDEEKTSAPKNLKVNQDGTNKIVRVSTDVNRKKYKYTIPIIYMVKKDVLFIILQYLGVKDTYFKFQFANRKFYNKIRVKTENFYNFFDINKLSEEYSDSKEIVPFILPVFKTQLPLNLIFKILKIQNIPDNIKFPIFKYLVAQKSPSTRTLTFLDAPTFKLGTPYNPYSLQFYFPRQVTYNVEQSKVYHENGSHIRIPQLPEFLIFEFDNENIVPQIKFIEDFEFQEAEININEGSGSVVIYTNLYRQRAKITLHYQVGQNKIIVAQIETYLLHNDHPAPFYLYDNPDVITNTACPEIKKFTFEENIINPIDAVKEKEFLRIKNVYSKPM